MSQNRRVVLTVGGKVQIISLFGNNERSSQQISHIFEFCLWFTYVSIYIMFIDEGTFMTYGMISTKKWTFWADENHN